MQLHNSVVRSGCAGVGSCVPVVRSGCAGVGSCVSVRGRAAAGARAMANLAASRAYWPRLERVQWLTSQDFARTIASTRHREARSVRQGMRDRVAGTRRGDA